jgi:hypothetical protein
MTGQPNMELPSATTITRDIKSSFNFCHDRIAKILTKHPGKVHFVTDAWTSLNHHSFVTWTVHLEHDSDMLTFLLDIIEVAKVRAQ